MIDDLTKAKREAYAQGVRDTELSYMGPGMKISASGEQYIEAMAARKYPATRPRVYRSGVFSREYRVVRGKLQMRDRRTGNWFPMLRVHTRDHYAAIVDLFDNPTETVPE